MVEKVGSEKKGDDKVEAIRNNKGKIVIVLLLVIGIAIFANDRGEINLENLNQKVTQAFNSPEEVTVQENQVKAGTPIELNTPTKVELVQPIQPIQQTERTVGRYSGTFRGKQYTWKTCNAPSIIKGKMCSENCVISHISWSGTVPKYVAVKDSSCIPR